MSRFALLLVSGSLLAGCYTHHTSTDRPDPRMCGAEVCADDERCCELCDDDAVCVGAADPCPSEECPVEMCASDFDCGGGDYCASPTGVCGGGACEPRPTGCFSDCPAVCGCDGLTYCNVCEAAQAGVSVLHPGACDTVDPCRCGPSQYCDYGDRCSANPFPVCTPLPTTCPGIDDPVCGCDGETYSNECLAAAVGVSVQHGGACGGADTEIVCASLCEWATATCGGVVDDCFEGCFASLEGFCTDAELRAVLACTESDDCTTGTSCLLEIGCVPIGMMD